MKYSIYTSFSPQLAAQISRFLLWEWKSVVEANFSRGALAYLREPQIAFTEDSSYLGRYIGSPVPRIEIARRLVLEHSWCALLSVFLHEVAHQLVHFIYGNRELLPHGKEFREVCRQIGAMPDASVDVVALDEQLAVAGRHESGLVEKLRKLFALANGGDENEAQLALAKAMELMSKYGITQDDIEGGGECVTAQVGSPVRRMDVTLHIRLNILKDYWGVYPVTVAQPDGEDPLSRTLTTMTISGPREKVAVAQYVFDYISNNMELAYARAKCTLHGANAHRDFCVGFLNGIKRKLSGIAENSQVYALIHKGDAANMEYVNARFAHLYTRRSRSASVNAGARDRGFSAGSKLDINPGVAQGGSDRYLKG